MKILSSPTLNKVLKVVAKLYLGKLGARRLIALDYRASEKGIWSQREDRHSSNEVNIAPPNQSKEMVKVPSRRKLENSIYFASLFAKGRGDQSKAKSAIEKVNELQNLLPESLADYDETQLNDYASRMIDNY